MPNIKCLKIIGADAVGMSTVPEIIVANHLKLKVAAVSVLTDECDPNNLKPVDIAEIIAMAEKAEPNMITLFKELIKTYNYIGVTQKGQAFGYIFCKNKRMPPQSLTHLKTNK